ncbi:hypothetical protein PLICRDRAFT_53955 [Plicaturopsis crispa FD-325 SS-3]|nr:hypothetical protein PLICRDRAFT_53955 [Plicaturopsis crispa FD-325 SS-3]
MPKYHVFLGAPSVAELRNYSGGQHWQQFESVAPATNSNSTSDTSYVLPPATLEAASRRISLIYQNVIFDEKDDDEGGMAGDDDDLERQNETTAITWPPTPANDAMDSRMENSAPTFLHPSMSRANATAEETQDTASYNYSDASSIGRFPQFHFSLHALTSLSSLRSSGPSEPGLDTGSTRSMGKITLLLAVLEVEGPDTIRIKKGKDAGKEVALLKMILGDEDGRVCKLTAWREVAEAWGGVSDDTVAVKRGDIVLVENVLAASDSSTSPTLTASPYLKSKLEICYRTMPYTHEDGRLRPDLRLGATDAAVRRVATVVAWFERIAGLDNAHEK